MSKLDCSVGIPVWNEELILVANTGRLMEHLQCMGDCEIMIVSNGSTDRTAELGRRLASENSRIRFFELPKRDVAEAFRTMLREARCDSLITFDMDLSADLSFVDRALPLLQTHDLVVGSKRTGEQRRAWIRKLGSDLYIRCANRLLEFGVDDYSMGAKAYRISFFREHIDRLGRGTSYVVNGIYIARWNGGRIAQIPVSCRDFRRSRFNLLQEGCHKFSHLIRLWLRHHRGRRG